MCLESLWGEAGEEEYSDLFLSRQECIQRAKETSVGSYFLSYREDMKSEGTDLWWRGPRHLLESITTTVWVRKARHEKQNIEKGLVRLNLRDKKNEDG